MPTYSEKTNITIETFEKLYCHHKMSINCLKVEVHVDTLLLL